MNWQSMGNFVEMGGYGFFVWSGFGVSLLGLVIEIISVRQRVSAAKKNRA